MALATRLSRDEGSDKLIAEIIAAVHRAPKSGSKTSRPLVSSFRQLLAGMKGYVEAASSNNTNAVATLDTPFADPDTESLRQKLNEMLLQMRRS